jgi:hypothetical protein
MPTATVKRGIIADFAIPSEDNRALRVQFDSMEVIRILDEMALSIEGEETPLEGLERDHTAEPRLLHRKTLRPGHRVKLDLSSHPWSSLPGASQQVSLVKLRSRISEG